jgi:hypothetical protein
MTRAAKQYLQDAFTRAQHDCILANNHFHDARERYDAKRRAGEQCDYEHAVYCDLSRKLSAAEKYASDCLTAVRSSNMLPTEV